MVLTQEHITTVDGKMLKHLHPIAYVSGLFQGSQLNGSALTKEMYTLYIYI